MPLSSRAHSILIVSVLVLLVVTPAVVSVDGDSLTVYTEIQGPTEPFSADTDGDGLLDGEEQTDHSTDPTLSDTDSDGLSDSVEVESKTSPINADTDDDGLSDGSEVQTHRTLPTESDSDADGLADGDEIAAETDPLAADTDADGLSDGVETQLGSNPRLSDTDDDGLSDNAEYSTYGTDPTDEDTDADGGPDAEEIELGTDPTESDTDFDGVEDRSERRVGTSPTDPDTDSDGFSDGVELNSPEKLPAGLDPLHRDVLIELDSTQDVSVTTDTLDPVVNKFGEAPVNNPDGQTGITVHVVTSPNGPSTEITGPQSFDEYYDSGYQTEFDLRGYGAYQVFVVDRIGEEDEAVAGGTNPRSDGILVETRPADGVIPATVAHELGHQLGISGTDFSGVDSDEYTYQQYSSVMNYNCRHHQNPAVKQDCGVVEFSSSGSFDDWEEIESSFPETTPSTDQLAESR